MSTSEPAVLGIRASKNAARARARLEAGARLRALGRRALKGISSTDPRFGGFVRALSAKARTLEEISDNDNLIRNTLNPEQIESALSALERAIVDAKQHSLTTEILAVFNPGEKLTHEAVLYRVGLLSSEPLTLQQAGDLIGVSRERIRQIQEQREKFLHSNPYMPVYSTLYAALNRAVMTGPRKVSDVEREMRERGILQGSDFVAQIVRLAQMRGEQRCQMERQLGHDIIGFPNHLERINTVEAFVTDFIESETKKRGACSRSTLLDMLRQRGYVAEAEDERLNLVLQGIPDLTVIRQGDQEWLRLRSRAYTIALMARKILCITPRIRVGELRRGIQRHHRVTTVPPSAVLGRIISEELANWNVTFDGEWVTASNPPTPEEVLPWLELMFYKALASSDGAMSRNDLLIEMKARGMNISSFGIMLGYSPIIESYGRSVYGLRGVPVTPGQVETIAAFSQKEKCERQRDFGHLADGRVWLTLRLGQYEMDHKVLYEPSAIRDYVADGEYTVVMDGTETGTDVSVSVNQIRFRRNLLEAIGAESGDYILLAFNRKEMTVEVAIGEENVITKISPAEPGTNLDGSPE